MVDVPIPADRVRDPWERNVPGLGLGRDPVRTPMLWSDAACAGFSQAEPWLPLSPDWPRINAARQSEDPSSVLAFYRALLALRRRHPALYRGAYRTVAAGDGVLAYERTCEDQRLLVVLNMTSAHQAFAMPAGEVLLDSAGAGAAAGGEHSGLRPGQGLVVAVKATGP